MECHRRCERSSLPDPCSRSIPPIVRNATTASRLAGPVGACGATVASSREPTWALRFAIRALAGGGVAHYCCSAHRARARELVPSSSSGPPLFSTSRHRCPPPQIEAHERVWGESRRGEDPPSAKFGRWVPRSASSRAHLSFRGVDLQRLFGQDWLLMLAALGFIGLAHPPENGFKNWGGTASISWRSYLRPERSGEWPISIVMAIGAGSAATSRP